MAERKIIGRRFLAVLAAALALACAGCASVQSALGAMFYAGKETEASRMLLDGANDIILAKEDGVRLDAFRAAFERKFSVSAYSHNVINLSNASAAFTYKGAKYKLSLRGIPNSAGTGFDKITSASGCKDVTPPPKK
ncbi:MAG: hypothetical protein LBC53_03675 [Spirochaetaceae bacterium]|jgi:type IV pilus biogenesis protein CpaD/CtpE|nr:hypothetical protein [Spirochaetaceae bacterium]